MWPRAVNFNLFGAYTAIAILSLSSLIFIFRLLNQKTIEYWIGIVFIAMVIPLIYLLLNSKQFKKPTIYYIQILTMIAFILIELILDYILTIDFRSIRWATIVYVMFFFAGTGGMIGTASQAGKLWAIISIILFFIMSALSFIQRSITDM